MQKIQIRNSQIKIRNHIYSSCFEKMRKAIDKMNRDPEFKRVMMKDKSPLVLETPRSIHLYHQQKAQVIAAKFAMEQQQEQKSEAPKFNLEAFKQSCPWSANDMKAQIFTQERLLTNTALIRALPDKGAKIRTTLQELKELQAFLNKYVHKQQEQCEEKGVT